MGELIMSHILDIDVVKNVKEKVVLKKFLALNAKEKEWLKKLCNLDLECINIFANIAMFVKDKEK
jgi:hypothetical protein